MLRHPAFVAFRSDKPAKQIVREIAVKPPTNGKGARKPQEAKEPDDKGDTIAGVKLSHSDKLLYPEQKVTKRQLAEYYESVAEWMLPHVVDRPLALSTMSGWNERQMFFPLMQLD